MPSPAEDITRWVCPDCNQEVEPLEWIHFDGTLRHRRRGYCTCAAGQAMRAADEAAFKAEQERAKIVALLQESGLAEGRARGQAFSTFEMRNPGIEEQVEDLLRWAENPRGWVLLHGPYGVGKSHLGVATAKQVVAQHGQRVKVVNWATELSLVKESWGNGGNQVESQIWGALRNRRFVVLDDLDKQAMTSWAIQKFYELVNYRYERELPTMVITNRDRMGLRRLLLNPTNGEKGEGESAKSCGAAIWDRMLEMFQIGMVMEIGGESYRIESRV